MTFEEVVAKVEAAGHSWAVDAIGDGTYSAIVGKKGNHYIADSLASGLGAESGATPADALWNALHHEAR